MLEALTVALGDASPRVVNAALDAIQPVVEALYRCTNLPASPRLKTPNSISSPHCGRGNSAAVHAIRPVAQAPRIMTPRFER